MLLEDIGDEEKERLTCR